MKYIIHPFLWLIIIVAGLFLIITAILTAVSWVFEMITDWFYAKTDWLWFRYCDLNAKILNKTIK